MSLWTAVENRQSGGLGEPFSGGKLMTSLGVDLCEIDDLLRLYPKASVQIKFKGSDNYCHFPSATVINDTVGDGVVLENFDAEKNDTRATLARHLSFSEWFKINALQNGSDTLATLGEAKCRSDDLATAEPHTRTPLGVRMDAGDAPTVDWADLSEMDFEKALQTITSIEELSGVANRRRILSHDFKQWSEVQKSLILNRKFILENENG